MILNILKIAALLVTSVSGALMLFNPVGTADFTGLDVGGKARGITEVRMIGVLFVALGLAPLIFRAHAASMRLMLGFVYLVVAVARMILMFVDGSVTQTNIVSVISEVVLGGILVWPAP